MRTVWTTVAILAVAGLLVAQYTLYPPEIQAPPRACDSDTLSSEDYQIYRALLADHASQYRDLDRTVIFVPETTAVPYELAARNLTERIGQELAESRTRFSLSDDAVTNFLRMSDRENELEREDFSDLSIVVAEESELDEIFVTRGTSAAWEALGYSRIVHFSRVGFDCHQSQGLLYQSYSCGGLCGSGDLLLVMKDGTEWRVVQRINLWIA